LTAVELWGAQFVPSVVASINSPAVTVTQLTVLEQLSDSKISRLLGRVGMLFLVQVEPPFVVEKIAPTCTMKQVVVVTQVTAFKFPDGPDCAVHVAPPLLVVMMLFPKGALPTAQHMVVVGQLMLPRDGIPEIGCATQWAPPSVVA
jgi:hypothetical protein